METCALGFLLLRVRRQKTDIQELLRLIDCERARIGPSARILVDLLVDIANESAMSGDKVYLLARRLDRILTSPRGEGRSVKEAFAALSDLYNDGLLTWLRQNFPELTPGDISLCAMLSLGVEPICISKVLGYDHEQTFYNKRRDLRKKLGMEHDVPLEQYLAQEVEQLRSSHEQRLRQLNARY